MDYKDEYSNWADKYDKFGAITRILMNKRRIFSERFLTNIG